MNLKSNEKNITLHDGCKLKIKSGKLAIRADGAVEVRYGNNVLLSTVVYNKSENVNLDFLPLHVDYQEKFYAIGRIPAGCKRELRLNDHEVLVSRFIDRCIRPCFEKGYKKDTQVNICVLSADENINPEYYSCFAASLSLLISDVEFNEPVSEVFLYYIDNKWVVNPKKSDIPEHEIKLVVGGNETSLLMCEGFFDTNDGLTEEVIIEGIKLGLEEIKNHCIIQKEFLYELGIEKNTKTTKKKSKDADTIDKKVLKTFSDKIFNIYKSYIENKDERDEKIQAVVSDLKTLENYNSDVLKNIKKEALTKLFLKNKKRIDGRDFDEIRHITCDIDYLPSAHGSALFTRGETQALVSVTLGDKKDEQPKEEAFENGYNKIILHYNFPSYSVGELSFSKNVGRREIGHGNLALNGLKAIIPDDNMFTIRIVSDILSSNGSSSMATVCGSCLALKDAGIQIKNTIAGIAMGLFYDKDKDTYNVLSDISSDEDELGDMDFKIIGTENGITGIQLDVKFLGLNVDILKDALKQARQGVNFIIKKLDISISKPRREPKDFAPQYTKIIVDKKMLGLVIGSGGSNIQNLQKEFNCTININSNVISIISKNKACLDNCVNKINAITVVPDKESIYDGIVKKVQENSALVEFLEGKVGVLKKEELDLCRVDDLTKILLVGDRINVKILEIQDNGRYLLSHRVLLLSSENNCKEAFSNVPIVASNNVQQVSSNVNNAENVNISPNDKKEVIVEKNNNDIIKLNNTTTVNKEVEIKKNTNNSVNNNSNSNIEDNKTCNIEQKKVINESTIANNNKYINDEKNVRNDKIVDIVESVHKDAVISKPESSINKSDSNINKHDLNVNKTEYQSNSNKNTFTSSDNSKIRKDNKFKKNRRVIKYKLSREESDESKRVSEEYMDQIPDNI